ncbi:fibrillarin-like rRNA/tRNA 2'-O-methyltransferase [Candidatus Bathyarchaeota archaeon]|nr:fibrillarin-like rRNA/tRNA 2'-O-methyltransferase [Candidatus Bathyarchaeota archaeon]
MGNLKIQEHEEFPNIFWVRDDGQARLATRSIAPEVNVYGEDIITHMGEDYRIWNPYRSKLAAAILKGIRNVPIRPGMRILYLGAASGTTVSHVSDIVGFDGEVYAVEISQRTIRDLIGRVCKHRRNVQPILADARSPSQYRFIVSGVDSIYCDVAQPEQAKILSSNSKIYLKKGGEAMIAIKARSVDVTLEPRMVFDMEIKNLRGMGFNILDTLRLEPYDKDHAMVTVKYVR